MKFIGTQPEFDATDRAILDLLQEDCKQPLAAIGSKVGLSAPAVVERIHKLEEAGVITGYAAQLDARKLGMDVTGFIGVGTEQPRTIGSLEAQVSELGGVLECHHVTGAHTLLLKVKVENTDRLESLIEEIRTLEGVNRTETMVVLSTGAERMRVPLARDGAAVPERPARRPRVRRSAK